MKTLLHLAMLAALSCTPAVHAGSLIDVGVVDRDTGVTLPAYPRDGKYYVIGVPGHRYGVRLVNRTGGRVLAVLSVDGVNAVSGETANPDQSGYVLDPYQSTEIEGWRKSMSEVAQFNFTALSNSYAARTGRPDNVGVIGVAVFREKPQYPRESSVLNQVGPGTPLADRYMPPPAPAAQAAPRPAQPSDSAAAEVGTMAKSAAAPAGSLARADAESSMRREAKQEESLGTGHGARETSNVSYTKFERAHAYADEVVSVWYDSYRNLVARGVVPPPPPPHRDPQPFPQGFVPDPAS